MQATSPFAHLHAPHTSDAHTARHLLNLALEGFHEYFFSSLQVRGPPAMSKPARHNVRVQTILPCDLRRQQQLAQMMFNSNFCRDAWCKTDRLTCAWTITEMGTAQTHQHSAQTSALVTTATNSLSMIHFKPSCGALSVVTSQMLSKHDTLISVCSAHICPYHAR